MTGPGTGAGTGTRTLFDRMTELLAEDEIPFERREAQNAVRIEHDGTDADWACIAQVWEDDHVFAVYSVSPLRPRPETIDAVSEFVHLANLGLLVGNFELDVSDGETRLKTSVGFGPSVWSDEIARVVLYTNLAAMDHYILGLLKVVTGASTARDALGEIE